MREKFARKIIADLKTSYDSIFDEFSKSRAAAWKEFELFLPYVKKGMNILDVGCGNGRFYHFLKDYELNYTGIDQSEMLIKEARTLYRQGTFDIGSMLELPYQDNSFDAVVCIAALHHVPSQRLRLKALEEINRVLKSGSTLFITVWNLHQKKYQPLFRRAFWRALFSLGNFSRKDLFVPWGNKASRYYYAFEFNEFRDLLTEAGLEIVEICATKKGAKVSANEAYNFCAIAKISK